jgi:hypothetical protein
VKPLAALSVTARKGRPVTNSGTTSAPLTVRQLPSDWTRPPHWMGASQADGTPGYYARAIYTLNLTTRELTVLPATPEEANEYEEYEIGANVTFDFLEAGVVPPCILLGTLDFRTCAEKADATHINRLLAELRDDAAAIIDNLTQVPGDGLDWSPAAWVALEQARHRINSYLYRDTEDYFPYKARSYVIDAADLLKRYPDLVVPEWAELDDDDLAAVAKRLHAKWSGFYRGQLDDRDIDTLARLSQVGHRLESDSGGDAILHFTLTGARAWLATYREEAAGGLTPLDAGRWDGIGRYELHIRDDSSDIDLTSIENSARRAAAGQNIKLLGLSNWSHDQREKRRRVIRAQTERLRDEIAELEARLQPAKKQRRALAARILSWGLTADTDSAVGRASGLSHTAVGSIRRALNDEESSPE